MATPLAPPAPPCRIKTIKQQTAASKPRSKNCRQKEKRERERERQEREMKKKQNEPAFNTSSRGLVTILSSSLRHHQPGALVHQPIQNQLAPPACAAPPLRTRAHHPPAA